MIRLTSVLKKQMTMGRNKIKIEITFVQDENGETVSDELLITKNGIDSEHEGVNAKELASMYIRVMAVKEILEENAKRNGLDIEKVYKKFIKWKDRGPIEKLLDWINGK